MRHSRRAVMAERYKLYAKKNILNSRYLVRNLQIGLLVFVVMAMLIGTVVLVNTDASKGKVATADMKVSVKDALFGNSEESESATEEVVTEQQTAENVTESVFAEKVQTELDSTITDVASNVAVTEEKKEEPKSKFDDKCIANVDETLNVRRDPSADSEFVGQMNNGAIATIEGTEGEWTKIKSGDVEGYVLTEYILTGSSAEKFAKDYVTLLGTVLEDGVNIRAEKSTDAEILTVMDKNDTITVLENPEEEEVTEDEIVVDATTEDKVETVATTEQITSEQITTETVTTEQTTEFAAKSVKEEVVDAEEEEIDWIPVMLEDGQTGYVSAELIDVDELYQIAVSAEELQRRAEEEAAKQAAEEAARQAAAEEAARQAAVAQSAQQSSNTSGNDNNDTYEGAVAEPVTATESGEYIGTFTITAYCGCSKCGTGSNRTASGTTPAEGRTIAADTSILPFGTQVEIGGVVYTVEDSGSGVRGNHIDIFFATHARALAFGRKTMKVYKY